ncbi:MAG: rod shape-determining protein RodA [Egibacteraceae bacterium]
MSVQNERQTPRPQITYSDERSGRMAREAVHRQWMGVNAPTRHVDVLLLASAAVLALLGLLFIYSASSNRLEEAGLDPSTYVDRQITALIIGVVAMAVVTLFDYRVYRAWSPVLYVGSLLLLVFVLIAGVEINGSKAWLVLGGFQFQPSELTKVALIAILAALFHERREEALGLRALIEGLVLAALPMGLILLQPDFGTFMVFIALTFGVLLIARVRVRFMVALAVIGVLAVAGAWQLELVKDYQVERLNAFLNPDEADDLGALYNVNQAQIAIGSGKLGGKGLFEGSQTALNYVPYNHTDFIFTVVGEETGFLGALVLLGAFGLLLSRGIRIAALSRDTFGTLLAGGVVAVMGFQLFINVGMTVGLMPVTGLPLPFVSYGGTSLITSFIMVGLLQNVHMRRFQ